MQYIILDCKLLGRLKKNKRKLLSCDKIISGNQFPKGRQFRDYAELIYTFTLFHHYHGKIKSFYDEYYKKNLIHKRQS